MGNKKKFLNIYYMFSLVALFVTFLGLFSNCYALTYSDIETFNNNILDTIDNQTVTTIINNFSTTNINQTDINNCDSIFCVFDMNNRLKYTFFDSSQVKLYNNYSSDLRRVVAIRTISNTAYLYEYNYNTSGYSAKYTDRLNSGTPELWISNTGSGDLLVFTSEPVYTNTNFNTEFASQYIYNIPLTPIIHNSISLNSYSNHKFGFNQKNQLLVNLVGYEITDFDFYIQRYIDNTWDNFTDINDFYYLLDFENPYYVFWDNINYFPVGTYRYMATYKGDNPFSTVSDSFEITNMYIDTPVDGTIDGNGNVDINIDNGPVIDNIKDFMGTEPNFNDIDITQQDIENALNINETVSPYANVVTLFVNGLTDALLSTGESNDFVFKVHTWGQTFTVHPSDVIPQYGQGLQQFMRTMSVIVFGWIIIKWSQQISETLSVADFSKTLELVEEKYSNLL